MRLQYRKRYYLLNSSGAAIGRHGKTLTALRPTEGKDGKIVDELVPRPYRAHDPEVLYFRNYRRAANWLANNPHVLPRYVKIECEEMLCAHHMTGETKAVKVLRLWKMPRLKKAKTPDAEQFREVKARNKSNKQRRFHDAATTGRFRSDVRNNANKKVA